MDKHKITHEWGSGPDDAVRGKLIKLFLSLKKKKSIFHLRAKTRKFNCKLFLYLTNKQINKTPDTFVHFHFEPIMLSHILNMSRKNLCVSVCLYTLSDTKYLRMKCVSFEDNG